VRAVMSDRSRRATALLVAIAIAGLGACGADDLAERRAKVRDRGAEVMPFALDATTHRFEPTDDGLIQTVVADDPDDADQVALIRQHLTMEAGLFAEGDLGDPASIHGDDMPGLAEIEAAAGSVEIEVVEVSDGARLVYTTDDPELVDALHSWAEAQVADHGEDAAED